MSKKKAKKFNKYKFVKFSILFALSLYASWTLITQEIELFQTKKQLSAVAAEIEKNTALKEDLVKQKEIVNTPEYIEKAARDELGYAAPDEIIFMDATQGY